MKKSLLPVLLCLSLLMTGCMSAAPEEDYALLDDYIKLLHSDVSGSNYHVFAQYSQNSDGTWTCGDFNYLYLAEIWGLDGIPARAVGYLVLTNDTGITFEEIRKSMYSSNTNDWIPASRAKLVGFIY